MKADFIRKKTVLLHVRAPKCDVYTSVTEFLETQFPLQMFPVDLRGGGVAPTTARTSAVASGCSAPAPHHWTRSASHWHNRCSGVFRSSSVGPRQWNPRFAFLARKGCYVNGEFLGGGGFWPHSPTVSHQPSSNMSTVSPNRAPIVLYCCVSHCAEWDSETVRAHTHGHAQPHTHTHPHTHSRSPVILLSGHLISEG